MDAAARPMNGMNGIPKRLLIANRGEIAVRIARTVREMGIEPIGVFAAADAGAFHTTKMSRSVDLGSGPAADTYLSIPRLLEAARHAGADAVHPGYGFLSENPEFARAVEGAGLLWIGPPSEAIEKMGDKLQARRRMRDAGVPVVPGSDGGGGAGNGAGVEDLYERGVALGFPLFVKASAGGGGKGMARVDSAETLAGSIEQTSRVAEAAFGDGRVYLEKLFERPRHVEFQVFGDRFGSVVHLFERECSVQRRHQKVLEETPSTALDPRLREAMGRAAVEAARAVEYVGAGTIEFLLDERKNFYFLEMNTRLQVEHPITEETLGIDLVRTQIEVAAGSPLPPAWRGGKLVPQGHAIELRLYAEDPREFLPRSGTIHVWEEPGGPGVRVDGGVEQGSRVGLDYDPLLAKLVVSAPDRAAAIERARRAVAEWVVLGVETNAELLIDVLDSGDFRSGRYSTDLIERLRRPDRETEPPDVAWIAAAAALSEERPPSSASAAAAPAIEGPPDPWDARTGWRPGA
jgi:acetyl/propionyl-CoA carboxylase alpha subunit